MDRVRFGGFVVATTLFAGIIPAGTAWCAPSSGYIAPVDGPITRRFDPPLGPYAAGHRGIDFGARAGSPVVASNAGHVMFAGPVADDGFFITIAHAGEISTTYSFLSSVSVSEGDRVRRGQQIAASGPGHGDGDALHFGAKFAGVYIDPEILLAGGLDDISDLIALAPMEEPVSAQDGIVRDGSSSLNGAATIHARTYPDSTSWSVRMGEKIAGFGEAMLRLGSGLVSTTEAVLGQRWKSLKLAGHLTWDAVKSGASQVGGFLTRSAKAIEERTTSVWTAVSKSLEAAGGWLSKWYDKAKASVTKSFGRWWRDQVETTRLTIAAIKWALGKLRSAFQDAKGYLNELIRRGRSQLRSLWRQVFRTGRILLQETVRLAKLPAALMKGFAVFVREMAKASVEQVRCSWKADAPPRLPSTKDLRRGAKAPPPPNDNIVVAIAGIGSSSSVVDGRTISRASMYTMDWETLGYSEDQVYHYSYKGIEHRPNDGPYRLHAAYTKDDTYRSIVHSAKELARQLEEVQRANPARKIDLVAHSQGGLIAQYFVQHLYQPTNRESPVLNHVVTIASPHTGSDSARLGHVLEDSERGRLVLQRLDSLAKRVGLPPPTATSPLEMSDDSVFIQELTGEWDPRKVPVSTISATFDYVVVPSHSRLPGAKHFTVDLSLRDSVSSHSRIVNAPSTKRYLYGTLSNDAVACTAVRTSFARFGVAPIVSGIQDQLVHLLDVSTNLAMSE